MKKQKLLIALLIGSLSLGSILTGWQTSSVSDELGANLLVQDLNLEFFDSSSETSEEAIVIDDVYTASELKKIAESILNKVTADELGSCKCTALEILLEESKGKLTSVGSVQIKKIEQQILVLEILLERCSQRVAKDPLCTLGEEAPTSSKELSISESANNAGLTEESFKKTEALFVELQKSLDDIDDPAKISSALRNGFINALEENLGEALKEISMSKVKYVAPKEKCDCDYLIEAISDLDLTDGPELDLLLNLSKECTTRVSKDPECKNVIRLDDTEINLSEVAKQAGLPESKIRRLTRILLKYKKLLKEEDKNSPRLKSIVRLLKNDLKEQTVPSEEFDDKQVYIDTKENFSGIEATVSNFKNLSESDTSFDFFVPGNTTFINTALLQSLPAGVGLKWGSGPKKGLDFSGDANERDMNHVLIIERSENYSEGDIVLKVTGKGDKVQLITIPIKKGLDLKNFSIDRKEAAKDDLIKEESKEKKPTISDAITYTLDDLTEDQRDFLELARKNTKIFDGFTDSEIVLILRNYYEEGLKNPAITDQGFLLDRVIANLRNEGKIKTGGLFPELIMSASKIKDLSIISSTENLDKKINKAEFVTMIGRGFYTDEAKDTCLGKAEISQRISKTWYDSSVCVLERENIVNTENMTETVNQAQAAKIITDVLRFNLAQTALWYEAALSKSLSLGITHRASYISPEQPVNKAQMAHMIDKAIEYTASTLNIDSSRAFGDKKLEDITAQDFKEASNDGERKATLDITVPIPGNPGDDIVIETVFEDRTEPGVHGSAANSFYFFENSELNRDPKKGFGDVLTRNDRFFAAGTATGGQDYRLVLEVRDLEEAAVAYIKVTNNSTGLSYLYPVAVGIEAPPVEVRKVEIKEKEAVQESDDDFGFDIPGLNISTLSEGQKSYLENLEELNLPANFIKDLLRAREEIAGFVDYSNQIEIIEKYFELLEKDRSLSLEEGVNLVLREFLGTSFDHLSEQEQTFLKNANDFIEGFSQYTVAEQIYISKKYHNLLKTPGKNTRMAIEEAITSAEDMSEAIENEKRANRLVANPLSDDTSAIEEIVVTGSRSGFSDNQIAAVSVINVKDVEGFMNTGADSSINLSNMEIYKGNGSEYSTNIYTDISFIGDLNADHKVSLDPRQKCIQATKLKICEYCEPGGITPGSCKDLTQEEKETFCSKNFADETLEYEPMK